MTKKVHSEIIKKWADGAEVQWYDPMNEKWVDVDCPGFYDWETYRIKPGIIRVALHYKNNQAVPIMWSKACIFAEIEKYDTFIQWLTEEIEYEM